jgi:hypothetical protein
MTVPLEDAEPLGPRKNAAYYVTPREEDWPRYDENTRAFMHPCHGEVPANYKEMPSMLDLTKEEAISMAVVHVFVDSSMHKGKTSAGGTPNLRKDSVVRGEFPANALSPPTVRAKAAIAWMREYNPTYAHWYNRHQAYLADPVNVYRKFRTSDFLRHSPGVEVAFRPWLYPFESFADTDVKQRLQALGRCDARSCPSMKDSFCKKICSRIREYSYDFLLQCLMLDILAVRSFYGILCRAEELGVTQGWQ